MARGSYSTATDSPRTAWTQRAQPRRAAAQEPILGPAPTPSVARPSARWARCLSSSGRRVARMHAGGSLIGYHQLGPTRFLFSFGGPRREHQLERAHLLVRGGDCATRDFSLGPRFDHVLSLHQDLYLTPVEQSLEIGEHGHRQWHTCDGSLGGVDLMQDQLHPRLGRGEQACKLVYGALMVGEHLLGVLQHPLALSERDFERCVRPPRHRCPLLWRLTTHALACRPDPSPYRPAGAESVECAAASAVHGRSVDSNRQRTRRC